MTIASNKYLPQLTSIRFFAAYLVVCHHFMPDTGWPPLQHFLDAIGDVAVSLFFVLSGFVLTLSNRDRDGQLTRSRQDYFVARVARIYPAYVLAFLLAGPFFILAMIDKYPGNAQRALHIGGNAVAYLSLLQAWLPWTANAWNGPAWSLSVECLFYVIFAFLPPPQRRVIPIWAIASVSALTATAAAATWLTPGNDLAWRFWYFFPPFRLGEFLLGIVVAQVFRHDIAHNLWRPHASWLAFAAGGILLLATTWCGPVAIRLASSICIPIGLLALAAGTGRITRLLAFAPLCLLGEASFGLYLIQVPVHDLYVHMQALIHGDPWNPYVNFAAYSLIAVAGSLIMHLYFERRALIWVKSVYNANFREAKNSLE